MTIPKRLWLKPYSVNGTGIRLRDYRATGAGVYEATRWLTLFFIPLLPISTWLIRPGTAEGSGLGVEYQFQIIGSRPLRLAAVVRTYARTIAAIIPLALLIWLDPAHGTAVWFETTVVIAACVWSFALIFFGERSGRRLYTAPATQPLPSGGSQPPRRAA